MIKNSRQKGWFWKTQSCAFEPTLSEIFVPLVLSNICVSLVVSKICISQALSELCVSSILNKICFPILRGILFP